MYKESRDIAENFLKDQFKIMAKYGSAPKLGKEAYQKLVAETQKTFRSLKAPEKLSSAPG